MKCAVVLVSVFFVTFSLHAERLEKLEKMSNPTIEALASILEEASDTFVYGPCDRFKRVKILLERDETISPLTIGSKLMSPSVDEYVRSYSIEVGKSSSVEGIVTSAGPVEDSNLEIMEFAERLRKANSNLVNSQVRYAVMFGESTGKFTAMKHLMIIDLERNEAFHAGEGWCE